MELNKIYNGDCLEIMADIPDGSVDMILCDLPYGTTACKWDSVIPFDPLWKHYERIVKDSGAIVLTASQPFTSALTMSNPKYFKHSWVWDKIASSNSLNAKIQPMKIHEDVLVFCFGKLNYLPQMTLSKLYKRKGQDTKGEHQRSINAPVDYHSEYRYPKSIIQFPKDGIIGSNDERKANCLHPTQKPVELMEYLIKTYTNEGETVLDNCIGSGTTAIACINTNRNFIGIEKEEKYFNIANERIKKHQVQLKLIA